jgi:hypothetical protein
MPNSDHWGKIGCHFPAKANPNADVWNIEFLPKGDNSTVAIDRVYMIPDGATVTTIPELQHYIVWTTDVTLVPESDAVCIEYKPNVDTPLSDIAIFCESQESSTSVNVAVFHESGLLVAKSDGDTVTQNVTMFGTTGQRRNTAVSGATLKKGLTYYIQYTNASNSFKPIVMDGWYGNYKRFIQSAAQSLNVANLNNAHEWRGTIDNTMGIFNMKPGDFFRWYSSGWTPGMLNDHIYMRSTIGANMQFSGIVGDPSNYHTIVANDLSAFLQKPYNSAFIWYVDAFSTLTKGSIMQKTTDTTGIPLFDFNNLGDEAAKTAALLVTLQTYSSVLISDGSFWYQTYIGYMVSLNSSLRNRVTSTTPLTSIPSDLVDGDLFYLEGNNYTWKGTTKHFVTAVYLYRNDDLLQCGNAATDSSHIYYDEVFDMTHTIIEYMTYIGTNSDLIDPQYGGGDWDSSYQSDGVRTTVVETDKKHYLEINGTEV